MTTFCRFLQHASILAAFALWLTGNLYAGGIGLALWYVARAAGDWSEDRQDESSQF